MRAPVEKHWDLKIRLRDSIYFLLLLCFFCVPILLEALTVWMKGLVNFSDVKVFSSESWWALVTVSLMILILSLSLSLRSLQRNRLQKLRGHTFFKYQSLQKLWVSHELWIYVSRCYVHFYVICNCFISVVCPFHFHYVLTVYIQYNWIDFSPSWCTMGIITTY